MAIFRAYFINVLRQHPKNKKEKKIVKEKQKSLGKIWKLQQSKNVCDRLDNLNKK